MLTWEFHDDWGDGANENSDPLKIITDIEAVAIRLFDTTKPSVDKHDFVNAFINQEINHD